MTDEATIEIRDETFNAEEALEAVEEAQDEVGDVMHGAVQVGDTVVHGDGCADSDVYVADVERGVSVGIVSAERVIETAENAIEDSFTEYVEGLDYLYSSNDVLDEGELTDKGDAVIHYQGNSGGRFKGSEINGLAEDDSVVLGDIESEDNTIEAAVYDDRDDEDEESGGLFD